MTDALAVLYEDAHVLAVAKPAGLLTQGRPTAEPTLEQAVRRYLSPDAPGSVYVGTVHRLDRPVSGVIVWAKTPRAARRLSAQLAARTATKEYWALVESHHAPPTIAAGMAGVWDDWLARSSDAAGVVLALDLDAPEGRRAVTRYRVEAAAGLSAGILWLRLWPETGRTHQLRAQAALRGLPIWGDIAYGSTRAFPVGIALHAHALTFRHPALDKDVTIVAPTPETWRGQGIDLSIGRGEG
jgi:23S rRNA pseudouridine1911/1915/1917 synthase